MRSTKVFTWNNMIIPALDYKWKIERKNERSLYIKCEGCVSDIKPDIYIEYINIPDNEILTVDDYLKKLMFGYKKMYDDILTTTIKLNNFGGYMIEHSISKDNRKLITIIFQQNYDIVTIVFSASATSYDEAKYDFIEFIKSLKENESP